MFGGSWFEQRIDVSALTAVLVIGDLLAIGGFVTLGQLRHTGQNPLTLPGELAGALAPFLIGWVLVALIGGLYTHDSLLGPRRMLSWTLPAWVLGSIIALALRATSLFPGDISGMFPVVAFLFGGLLVVGWRLVAATVLTQPAG